MHRPFSTIENPFTPHRDRSTDDPALVGKILGPEAEKVMRSASAKATADKGNGESDLELTNVERARIAQEQKERSPEWKMKQARKELFAWAKEIGMDKKWANKTFIIHSDGTLTVEGDLLLSHFSTSVKRLPKGLTRVDGNLDLRETAITSLEGFPQEIGGDLDLGATSITSLKGLPQKIGGSLDLSFTSITSLKGLPQEIHGYLTLEDTPITSLEGMSRKIDGTLFLYRTLITSLKGLPETIGENLDLGETNITSLDGLPPPENIGGEIEFSGGSSGQIVLADEAAKRGYDVSVHDDGRGAEGPSSEEFY